MALDALEWGVILVMGAGILLWGPDRIPEMAKTLAQAKKQFDAATKDIQGLTKELQTGLNTGNLSLDTISNAIIGAGTGTSIPSNPRPEEIAKATGRSPVSVTPSGAAAPAVQQPPRKTADEMLVDMARSLNIDIKGKTREEISQAIMDVAGVKNARAAAPQAPAPESAPPTTNEVQTETPAKPAEAPPEPSPAQ